jgi:hypothetical protein
MNQFHSILATQKLTTKVFPNREGGYDGLTHQATRPACWAHCLSTVIFHGSTAPAAQSADDEKLKIDKVRRWLSEPGNDLWVLIFDNYDDPHLPGIRSLTGYNIQLFFLTRSQNSIIITSRSTKLPFSKQLKL